MSDSKISGHYSQAYDDELQQALDRLLEMGILVQQQLADALTAFVTADVDLAEQVIEMDRRVNTYEVDIDEHCLDILVRRQPAATDLRLVIAVLKCINDVERIGDQARHIARHMVHEQTNERPNRAQLDDILEMGRRVQTMLSQAMDSFKNMDATAALNVLRQDRAIDSDYGRILRHNLTYMLQDARLITSCLEISWIARALERIGDHAHNICQHSIFLTKGKNVAHLSEEEVRAVVEKRGPQ